MKTPEELLKGLQSGHVDDAIITYKEAQYIIDQFNGIKQAALEVAEKAMVEAGETHHKAIAGSCGWTKPKKKKLDKSAWAAACDEDEALYRHQLHFDNAKAMLERAQKPFMFLPDGRFFIR